LIAPAPPIHGSSDELGWADRVADRSVALIQTVPSL
jgi:hypothetical protein